MQNHTTKTFDQNRTFPPSRDEAHRASVRCNSSIRSQAAKTMQRKIQPRNTLNTRKTNSALLFILGISRIPRLRLPFWLQLAALLCNSRNSSQAARKSRGVRPSPGAATETGQPGQKLRKRWCRQTLLRPGTGALRFGCGSAARRPFVTNPPSSIS